MGWHGWFFRAYLRGTYLPGLSGNLTPAPLAQEDHRRSNAHPPCSFETISRFPTSPRTHPQTHIRYHALVAFPTLPENSDRTLSSQLLLGKILLPRISTRIRVISRNVEFYFKAISAKICLYWNTQFLSLSFFFNSCLIKNGRIWMYFSLWLRRSLNRHL